MHSILLVKTSSLGDVVHNLPVVSDIHARFPQARIDWAVEEGFADIPRLHPAVRRVIPVAVRRWRRSFFSAASLEKKPAFFQFRPTTCNRASAGWPSSIGAAWS